MPLYKVTDTQDPDSKPRLVEAPSKSRAISHVASARFSAVTMDNVTDTAKLMASGVTLETAGAALPDTVTDMAPTNEQIAARLGLTDKQLAAHGKDGTLEEVHTLGASLLTTEREGTDPADGVLDRLKELGIEPVTGDGAAEA